VVEERLMGSVLGLVSRQAVGWRFVNGRRAVNLDPNCGWARGKADVLYVADAFTVMRKVNALLRGK
jgi:electron transfer flavoprotein alpha subunit